MAGYGLELFDEQGKRTLSITDRVGHFLGSFDVPKVLAGLAWNQGFNIPVEHQNMGEIFTWYNPQWQMYRGQPYSVPSVLTTITATQTRINILVSVGSGILASEPFKVWYGVK